LESFIDASYLLNLEYSADPTPYFRYLKENYPSGYLTVPTFGAGTANTEFEVITGMNIDYFGTGEYPYNTVLKEKTCESLANNLRAHGYYSTAIHNNTATFYDRNLVFANMGFDRFVSSDFMSDLEYTSVGWAKDNCMVKEIEKALTSTTETDLVSAISVQPHGKYPDKYEQLEEMLIDVSFKKNFSTDDKTIRMLDDGEVVVCSYQYEYKYFVVVSYQNGVTALYTLIDEINIENSQKLGKNDVIGTYNNEYFNCVFKKDDKIINYHEAIK
jgi:phosphoglycerol transferase MdoB-like AlkP superfamily enzyme